MNTSELLEKITDRGTFELLATAILAKVEAKCQHIIHFGINAQGETIPAPNDGFCKIPHSDPPHFVMVQHATTDRSGLSKKWLSEGQDKGDLIKAGDEAKIIRQNFKNAEFTVILSTNQRIPSSTTVKKTKQKKPDLASRVYTKAKELNVEAIIYEQSKYARYLDNERDGQYLRWKYLGTDAQVLSRDLLEELCMVNCKQYESEFQITPPQDWVERTADIALKQTIANSEGHLICIVGRSGSGKSAMAFKYMQDVLSRKMLALHVPESLISVANNLDEVIEKLLCQLNPTLLAGAASQVTLLLKDSEKFTVIVDDVNRLSNTKSALEKLSKWAKTNPNYQIIVPVWERYKYSLQDNALVGLETSQVICDLMSEEEGTAALLQSRGRKGKSLTKLEARRIVAILRYDSLLIGLYSIHKFDEDNGGVLPGLDSLISSFVRGKINTLSDSTVYTYDELNSGLVKLGSEMLLRKDLYPEWSMVLGWFASDKDQKQLLREVINEQVICSVSDGRLKFIHDRILNHFLVQGCIPLLEDFEQHNSTLTDPYYSEIVGNSLAKREVSTQVIRAFENQNILALINSLPYLEAATSSYKTTLLERIASWLKANSGRAPQSVRGNIANFFLNFDSPSVLDLLDRHNNFGLEVNYLGSLARFRNGDVAGAIHYCLMMSYPDVATNNLGSLWLNLVEHARQIHPSKIERDLHHSFDALDSTPDNSLLIVCGFLQIPSLFQRIVSSWEASTQKTKLIEFYIWCAIRYSTDFQSNQFLKQLFEYWDELPDTAVDAREKQRELVGYRLGKVILSEIDSDLLDYLLLWAEKSPNLKKHIAKICNHIDLPMAVIFGIINTVSDGIADLSSPLTSGLRFVDVPHPQYTETSLQSLARLWQNQSIHIGKRQVAFYWWCQQAKTLSDTYLDDLQQIEATDLLFDTVLWQRALAKDLTCVSSILSLARDNPRILRVAAFCWNDEFTQIAEDYLSSFGETIFSGSEQKRLNPHYYLAETLIRIDPVISETLLTKHWDTLKYSSLFVQAAFIIGTPKLLHLAHNAIDSWEDDSPVFEHISFGVQDNIMGSISHFLANLIPYKHLLLDQELSSFINLCQAKGEYAIVWLNDHLKERVSKYFLEKELMKYHPNRSGLMSILDAETRQYGGDYNTICRVVNRWVDDYNLQKDRDESIAMVQEWLQSEPTAQRLILATACVESLSDSRRNIELLEEYAQILGNDTWQSHAARQHVLSVKHEIMRRTLT